MIQGLAEDLEESLRDQWLRLGIKPVLFRRHNADPDYRADLGHSKRMLERFFADDQFRDLCHSDSQAARQNFALVRDPEELRTLWEQSDRPKPALAELAADTSSAVSLRRVCAFTLEKVKMRQKYRHDSGGKHPVLRAWRERQVARSWSELGSHKAENLVHAPWVVELGRGCSVGCWFCGVDAPKLGDQALYSQTNRQLWRECLEVMGDLLGPEAARWGFCYWATDPLDNPDYESYLLDFHELLGSFPQTTTAQAQKHVERVKALLKLSDARGGLIDRFSVLTMRQWNDLHAAFDPAETTFVECVPQNKEALVGGKSTAGRALRVNRTRAEKGLEPLVHPASTSTIACVSGFLVNLVERTVRLITPCNANDRWPLGYWIVDHGTFGDGRSLRKLCLDLIERSLSPVVRHWQPVRFRRDLNVLLGPDGFRVSSFYQSRSFEEGADLGRLGQQIGRGDQTACQIALGQCDQHGVPLERTYDRLNMLFADGVLDEEPRGGQNSLGQWIPAP